MQCNCCDGTNPSCNCMHHKMPMFGSLGIVVLGVVLFLTNYGWLNAGIWKWLLPLAIIVAGLQCGMMCGSRMPKK